MPKSSGFELTAEGRAALANGTSIPERLDALARAFSELSARTIRYYSNGQHAVAMQLMAELRDELVEITCDVRTVLGVSIDD